MDALGYAVERLRLRHKEGVPTMLGVAAVSSQDGASSVSRSLAAVLAADPDPTVCLVDLDRRSRRPGPGDMQGVADVAFGSVPLDDVLVPTANPRLKYLPLGRVGEGSVALLQRSREFERLLDDLRMRFTHVLLALPPLLASSEALAFVSHCDACVVVVEQGVTSRGDLREALDSLGDVRLLGVVMNRVESKVPRLLQRLISG
jgi:Mrp family chromosome partitioning ATPase